MKLSVKKGASIVVLTAAVCVLGYNFANVGWTAITADPQMEATTGRADRIPMSYMSAEPSKELMNQVNTDVIDHAAEVLVADMQQDQQQVGSIAITPEELTSQDIANKVLVGMAEQEGESWFTVGNSLKHIVKGAFGLVLPFGSPIMALALPVFSTATALGFYLAPNMMLSAPSNALYYGSKVLDGLQGNLGWVETLELPYFYTMAAVNTASVMTMVMTAAHGLCLASSAAEIAYGAVGLTWLTAKAIGNGVVALHNTKTATAARSAVASGAKAVANAGIDVVSSAAGALSGAVKGAVSSTWNAFSNWWSGSKQATEIEMQPAVEESINNVVESLKIDLPTEEVPSAAAAA